MQEKTAYRELRSWQRLKGTGECSTNSWIWSWKFGRRKSSKKIGRFRHFLVIILSMKNLYNTFSPFRATILSLLTALLATYLSFNQFCNRTAVFFWVKSSCRNYNCYTLSCHFSGKTSSIFVKFLRYFSWIKNYIHSYRYFTLPRNWRWNILSLTL